MKETKNREFKREITNTFLKTISAFANFGGGIIEFGVDDDGTSVGIKNPDKACQDIENRINDSIKPKPDFSFEINRRINVISLSIGEGEYKPYLYKGKAYKRSDTSTVEVDQIELKRLILEGNNMYYEQLPYNSKKELIFNTMERKFANILGIKKITKDILRTLDLFNDKGKFNNAAGLMADNNNFPGIDIVRFGKNINEIMERKTIDNQSLLQQYDKAVAAYERYYTYEKIEGAKRTPKEMIPKEAFREAVANALVHRAWDVKPQIQIGMYPDHIEITSPGGLPNGITAEEYLRGNISNLRNPLIGNIFFRLRIIEMFGTGIKRIKYAYEASASQPDFNVQENSITIKLPLITKQLEMTTDERKIYVDLSGGRVLASSEIASRHNMTKNKALRIISELVRKEYVKTVGQGRGTRYTVK